MNFEYFYLIVKLIEISKLEIIKSIFHFLNSPWIRQNLSLAFNLSEVKPT